MGWLGDLVDNVKAIFTGEKKPFEKNVKSKKKTTKSSPSKKKALVKNSDGTFTARSSGKKYNDAYSYAKAVSYAKKQAAEKPFDNFQRQYQRYKNGEISLDDIRKYNTVDQRRKRIADQKEYNKKYAEDHKSHRGMVDRLLGVLGYNGVIEGLYNVLDDDESTTFLSGLKSGVKYMNPFENDVSNRHFGSDLVKLLEQPDSNPDAFNLEDVLKGLHGGVRAVSKLNPVSIANKTLINPITKAALGDDALESKLEFDEKARKAVTGLGYDIALDPVSYVSGAFTAPLKLLKGSGYGVDVVKAVKQGENLSSAKQVATKLRELSKGDEANVAKFKKYTGMTTADDFAEDAKRMHNLTKDADDTVIRQTAERMSNDFNETVRHMFFDGDVRQGVTVGFGNLPFASKKGAALRKEIIKSDTLRKIGDRSISPYYNSLAKRIRTSNLGKMFSTNDLERIQKSGNLSNKTTQNLYSYDQMNKKLQQIMRDSEVYKNAENIEQFTSGLTKDELYSFYDDIEHGNFAKMRDYIAVRQKLFNEAFETDKAGNLISKATGEIFENTPEGMQRAFGDMLDGEDIGNMLNLSKMNDENIETLNKYINEYIKNATDADNVAYRMITGKTAGMATSDADIIENIALVDKFKNITSWKGFLKNVRLSDDDFVNTARQKLIQQGSEEAAKKYALNMEKDALRSALRHYDDASNTSSDILRMQNLSSQITKNADELQRFVDSEKYDFYQKVEKLLVDDVNVDRVNTTKTPYVITNSRTTSERLRKIDDLNKHLNIGKDMDEVNSEKAKEIANLIMEDFWEAAKQEIRVSGGDVAKEEAFFKHRYNYLYHQLTAEKKVEIFGEMAEEDKNGSFKHSLLGMRDIFNKARKDGSATISEINKDERIMEDRLHEIYCARLINSDKLIMSRDAKRFIQENFSKPLATAVDTPEEGYSLGALYDDINELFQESARKVFGKELSDYRLQLRDEIRSNPFSFDLGTYAGNVQRIQKAMDDKAAGFSQAVKDYADDPNRLARIRSEHKTYMDATAKQLEAAEDVFEKHINAIVDKMADTWKNDNVKSIMDEEWSRLADEFLSKSDGKKVMPFTSNITIQKLSSEQNSFLQELARNIKKQKQSSEFGKSGRDDAKVYFDAVRQYDDSIIQRTNMLSRTQKMEMQNSFLKLYDTFLNKWKLANTLYAPSFHVQNALSNAFQSFLGIGADAFNPAKIKKARDVLKLKDPKQTVTLGGKTYTYKQLEHIARESGAVSETFMEYDLGKGGKSYYENGMRQTTRQSFKDVDWSLFHPFRTISEASTVIGTNLEGTQRMNLFMSALDQGCSVDEAKTMVNKFLFDYGDLTEFEQNTMKRIIPFYTFMRKNLPMELRQMLEQPSTFSTIDKGLTEFEKIDKENYVNENHRNKWRQNFTQIPFTRQGINLQLPYYQLDRLDPNISFDDEGDDESDDRSKLPFNKVIGSTSPLIKLFPELAMGEYIYTEMPTNNLGSYLANQTTLSGLAHNYFYDDTGELKDKEYWGLDSSDLNRYFAFPIDFVNDVTVNNFLLYDVNTGEYIGK